MSKLVKLKLASKKSLACFLPSRMASAGTSTLFPSTEPEAPDDRLKPGGTKAVDHGSNPKVSETRASAEAARPANLGREIVTYGVEPKKEKAEVEEPEEILELKTPGFVRVFGCDDCADSDTEIRLDADNSSSEASEDESLRGSHLPAHLIPVVHLRVPMRNEDDIRKVVAALQIKGVLEVACDLENQIVKVSGNADPDRLLKKVKKVRRKSKLISYSNPSAMPQSNLHSEIPFPTPPPPAYVFTQPAYEERFRPPSQPHAFSRESHGPFSVPPPHVRPAAQPRHYDNEAFYHHQHPPPNVRTPRSSSSSRITPHITRVIKTHPTTHQTRNMAFLFPRVAYGPAARCGYPAVSRSEFAPLFSLFDDSLAELQKASRHHARKTFNPRFDVKEAKEAYSVEAELPGVDQKDLTIEFTDEHTLTIKGRTEKRSESGTPPTAVEAAPEKPAVEDTPSEKSHQPTVEDEAQAPAESEKSTEVAATPAETTATEAPQEPSKPKQHYWISERRVGEFSRSFSFPTRVDQDAVTASLKNGILSIVVPKAPVPESRRINIE